MGKPTIVRRNCRHRFPTSAKLEETRRELVELFERPTPREWPINDAERKSFLQELVKICVRRTAALYESEALA